MSTKKFTGAEIVIHSLHKENTEFVFGYPGGAVLNIYDAIFQLKKFKHVLVRHEKLLCMQPMLTPDLLEKWV